MVSREGVGVHRKLEGLKGFAIGRIFALFASRFVMVYLFLA
jgi:hypothetical protein